MFNIIIMANSDTSSEVKVKYSNSEKLIEDNTNKKPQSTDTDYYFDMISNPNKIIVANNQKISETSDIENVLKNTDSDSSNKSNSSNKSKPVYDSINISQVNPTIPVFKTSDNENTETNKVYETLPNTANVKYNVPEPKQLTPQENRMKKIELLRKLCEIKAKGYQLSKDYDFNSSLEEMEYEYELLKSFADKRNGVKIFKNGMLQAVSVVEFLNDKYDPFDFQLSGWGEHMSVEADSWEDILEEIYEKYKGSGKKMAPEIKLLYLIIASASAFHFTKSQAAKLPGLDSVLSSNPGLLSKIMNTGKAKSSQFMTAQELNIEKQREELKKKESESRQKQQQMQQQQIQQLQAQINKQNQILQNQKQNQNTPEPTQSMFEAAMNSNMFGSNNPQASNIKTDNIPRVIPDIRAPDQVKNILDRIHNIQPSSIKQSNTETQDETSSNNERLVSETTLSESKKKGRKSKKSSISIL